MFFKNIVLIKFENRIVRFAFYKALQKSDEN